MTWYDTFRHATYIDHWTFCTWTFTLAYHNYHNYMCVRSVPIIPHYHLGIREPRDTLIPTHFIYQHCIAYRKVFL